jgi:hypothetical protein
LELPDQYLVRRKDNQRPLSIMTKKYQVIQNHETFAFADDIIGSGQAVWDTAGSINGGRVVFMQVELEGHLFLKSNPEDKTVKKVLFVNSHDGSKALMGMITPVRVVCQNTLNAALGSKSNQFKVYHRKNFQSKKEEDAANLVFNKDWTRSRISFMESRLPPWMKDTEASASYGVINFSNASKIWGIPQGADIIRSYTPSVVFQDEIAFQPEAEGAYVAATASARKIIAVSSANPSWFGETCGLQRKMFRGHQGV